MAMISARTTRTTMIGMKNCVTMLMAFSLACCGPTAGTAVLLGAPHQDGLPDHGLDPHGRVGRNLAAVLCPGYLLDHALAQRAADLAQPALGDGDADLRRASDQFAHANVARGLLAVKKTRKQVDEPAEDYPAHQAD